MEHANAGAKQPCPTCRSNPGIDPNNPGHICPTCHGSGMVTRVPTPIQRVVQLVRNPASFSWTKFIGFLTLGTVLVMAALLLTGKLTNISLSINSTNVRQPSQCPDPNHLPPPGQGPPGEEPPEHGPPPGCPTPTGGPPPPTATASPTPLPSPTPTSQPTATSTAAPPTLFIDPLSFLYPSCANQQAVISVQNTGTGTLIWNATYSGGVHSVQPIGGSIPTGGSQMVTISDISGNGSVTIAAEAQGSPKTVTITCGS